jgi:hypothetical protein
MAHTCRPSYAGTEAGGFLEPGISRPSWATEQDHFISNDGGGENDDDSSSGGRYGSMVEHLCNMHEVLPSVPNITKRD